MFIFLLLPVVFSIHKQQQVFKQHVWQLLWLVTALCSNNFFVNKLFSFLGCYPFLS